MRPVRPCYVKFSGGPVIPAYDAIQFFPLVIFIISSLGCYETSINIMPPFRPNDHMLATYSDKGKEPWEIFAWCVRDAMAKSGGFKTSEILNREKLAFEKFMNKTVDSFTYQGKTYFDPDDLKIQHCPIIEPLIGRSSWKDN
jgi:hypothetical protein